MKEIGIKSDKKLIDKLLIYILILKKWNKKINLTAFTNDFDIVKHHFLDSLAITKFIEQKKISDDYFSRNTFDWIEVLKDYKDKKFDYLEIGSLEGNSAIFVLKKATISSFPR